MSKVLGTFLVVLFLALAVVALALSIAVGGPSADAQAASITATASCPAGVPRIQISFPNRPDLNNDAGILDFSDGTSFGQIFWVSNSLFNLNYPVSHQSPLTLTLRIQGETMKATVEYPCETSTTSTTSTSTSTSTTAPPVPTTLPPPVTTTTSTPTTTLPMPLPTPTTSTTTTVAVAPSSPTTPTTVVTYAVPTDDNISSPHGIQKEVALSVSG